MKALWSLIAIPLAAAQAQNPGSKVKPKEKPIEAAALVSLGMPAPEENADRPGTARTKRPDLNTKDQLPAVPGLRNLDDLDGEDFIPQELILRLKPELSVQQRNRFLADIEVEEVTFRSKLVPGLMAVKVRSTVRATLGKAGTRTDVLEFIAPNGVVEASSASTQDGIPVNDPLMNQLWGFDPDHSGTNGVYPAWDYEIGSEKILIGVVDTGVGLTGAANGTARIHPDLEANMWINEGEIPGNGVDDDENGFIDDINGWDFTTNTPDTSSIGFHGTHVAGTIAAVGNNGVGLSGVMQRAKIVSAEALLGFSGQGASSWILAGMEYCGLVGCKVINLSLGRRSPGVSDPYYDLMIDALLELGAITVVAAMNDMVNAIYSTPANSPLAVTVGATSPSGGPMEFGYGGGTNWGDVVDVCAPGTGVWSTAELYQGTNGPPLQGASMFTYVPQNGTSMAAPYASGVLGLGFAAIEHGKTDLADLSPREQAEALIAALIETGTEPETEAPIGTLVDPAAFLRRIIPGCAADLSGDGQVSGDDLGILLGAWGANLPAVDLDGDGIVGAEDLTILLGSWSFCNRTVCGDGLCGTGESGSCPEDCGEPVIDTACPAGEIEDCTGLACMQQSLIGDGFCDSWLLNHLDPLRINVCCYDTDGGDCTTKECQLSCPDGQLIDCAGNCVPMSLLCDGFCDEPSTSGYDLNCEQMYWDGGDCPTPGDPVCGDGICEALEAPGWCSDCPLGVCPDGRLADCDNPTSCMDATWLGDGWCDGIYRTNGANLCCYGFDDGDCSLSGCTEVICGDGICLPSECPGSCPQDCKSCPEGYVEDDDGCCTYSCALNLTGSATCQENGQNLYEFFFPGCQLASVSYDWYGETYQYDVSNTSYMSWPDWPDGCRTFSFVFRNGEEASIELCNTCSTSICGDGTCELGESPATCPEDCKSCPQGQVLDCDESGQCWDQSWINDGYCDGVDQAYDANLCCYGFDGGDCTEEECE